MKIEVKQKLARYWFCVLQDVICLEVEKLEKEHGSNIKFKKNKWKYGEFRTIKGEVIEKGGVAFSNVVGKFPKEFAKKIPGTNSNNTNFWSSGVSAVFHPKNPKVPAMHFNTRFICTQKSWFGGGIDITPCIDDNKEKKFFHGELKKICDIHNKRYYPKYKQWCDRYFYLPHRNEARGMGGIFFDNMEENWDQTFRFIKDVGQTFLNTFPNIVIQEIDKKWTKRQREKQLIKRGRYVEFNLLYDKGTAFGLKTGGNIDAIFMSLPPSVSWL